MNIIYNVDSTWLGVAEEEREWHAIQPETSNIWKQSLTLQWKLWHTANKQILLLNTKRTSWPPSMAKWIWLLLISSLQLTLQDTESPFLYTRYFPFHIHNYLILSTVAFRWVPPPPAKIINQLQDARLFSLLWSNLVQKSGSFPDKPHPICQGIDSYPHVVLKSKKLQIMV